MTYPYTFLDKYGVQIELFYFDESEYKLRFIADVSDVAWGESGLSIEDDLPQREPFTPQETIERLNEFATLSFAWKALAMKVGAEPFSPPHMDDDTDFNMDIRELMERILKEIGEQ